MQIVVAFSEKEDCGARLLAFRRRRHAAIAGADKNQREPWKSMIVEGLTKFGSRRLLLLRFTTYCYFYISFDELLDKSVIRNNGKLRVWLTTSHVMLSKQGWVSVYFIHCESKQQ